LCKKPKEPVLVYNRGLKKLHDRSKEQGLEYNHGLKTCTNRSKNRIENHWLFEGFEITRTINASSILGSFKEPGPGVLSNSKNRRNWFFLVPFPPKKFDFNLI